MERYTIVSYDNRYGCHRVKKHGETGNMLMDIEVDGAFHEQMKGMETIEEITAFRESLAGKEIMIDYHHPHISIASNVRVL